jgi:hypothetical protein
MKTNYFLSALFFAGFLFVSLQLPAQEMYEIKGRVQNTRVESIKGAIVCLLAEKTLVTVAQTKCNENGEFQLSAVAPGEYRLIVKKNGEFRAKSKTVVIDDNGEFFVQNLGTDNPDQSSEFVAETDI